MAIYTFENRKTSEEFDHHLPIGELDQYLIDNPDLFVVIKPKGFIPHSTGIKADEGFRDILREIKKVNPGNTINIV